MGGEKERKRERDKERKREREKQTYSLADRLIEGLRLGKGHLRYNDRTKDL